MRKKDIRGGIYPAVDVIIMTIGDFASITIPGILSKLFLIY